MIGLRKDGFHELQSFFQAINLGDDILLSTSSKDFYQCNDPSLNFNKDNFVYQALALFRNKTNILDPVSIELIKRIPKGAGLGGGSSNIATLLWGLNKLFGEPASVETLLDWSKEISSDAPFFFSLGSAVCEGRGEKIAPVERPPMKEQIWIVKPPYSLSTKEVYLYSKKQSKISESLKALIQKMYSSQPILENDLEEAAFLLCPQLVLLKDELEQQGYQKVFMTGSGSAYVCIGNQAPKCKNPVQIFPVRYINRNPNEWYQKG